MSLFTNLAKGMDKRQLGLLRDQDGNVLESPEASLTVLVDTHFPGNTVLPDSTPPGLWQPHMRRHAPGRGFHK